MYDLETIKKEIAQTRKTPLVELMPKKNQQQIENITNSTIIGGIIKGSNNTFNIFNANQPELMDMILKIYENTNELLNRRTF